MAILDKTGILGCQEFRRDGLRRPQQLNPEPVSGSAEPELTDNTNSQLLASLSEAIALLQPAQDEIERLQAELLEAREAHRKVALELVALERREGEAQSERDQARDDGADIQRQALREEILRQEKRRQRAWWRLGR